MSSVGRIRTRTSRTRKCISLSSELNGSSVASLSGNQSSLGLLQSMLGQVEADLDTMSPDTEPGPAQSPNQHRTQGLTGFSVALISTVGRLVHHLKKVQQGTIMSPLKPLIDRVHILHILISLDGREGSEGGWGEEQTGGGAESAARPDWCSHCRDHDSERRGCRPAGAADLTLLSKSSLLLVSNRTYKSFFNFIGVSSQAGLLQRTTELEQKLDAVVLLIGGLGLLEAHTDPPRDSEVKAAGSYCQSVPVPERIQVSASPAVLLSPPRQSDNWQHVPGNSLILPQHNPLLNNVCKNPNFAFPPLSQWLTPYHRSSFFREITSAPLRTSRPCSQLPASPASLSPAFPLLPHSHWRPPTRSAHSSTQRPCWLRSLSWAGRTSWYGPSWVRLRASARVAEDRPTVASSRGDPALAALGELHLRVLERGGRQGPAAHGDGARTSRSLMDTRPLARWGWVSLHGHRTHS